jgi:YidC/Oxa1 family membrane protein insertase
MPTPGSEAALAREARMAKKSQRRGFAIIEEPTPAVEGPKPTTQRVQPVNPKNRNKKKK